MKLDIVEVLIVLAVALIILWVSFTSGYHQGEVSALKKAYEVCRKVTPKECTQ